MVHEGHSCGHTTAIPKVTKTETENEEVGGKHGIRNKRNKLKKKMKKKRKNREKMKKKNNRNGRSPCMRWLQVIEKKNACVHTQ